MTRDRSGGLTFTAHPLLEVKNLSVEYLAANGTVTR
jgi:hypothetical protein